MPWWDFVFSQWVVGEEGYISGAGIREASGKGPSKDLVHPLVTLMEMQGPWAGERCVFLSKTVGFQPHQQSY